MSGLPLHIIDETVVHDAQNFLCKSIGLHQVFLHLKGKYVRAEGDIRRLKLAQEEAEARKKTLEEELVLLRPPLGRPPRSSYLPKRR